MSPEDVAVVGNVPVDESVKINGPPGMGKTTQGMRRVYDLVRSSEYDYNIGDVAWVTYRKSLAEDVLTRGADWGLFDREQVKERPWKGDTRLWGTIHAVAKRISDSPRYYELDPASWYDKTDFMQATYSLQHSNANPSSTDYGELIFRVRDWLISNQFPMAAAAECRAYSDLRSKWSTHPGLIEFDEQWESYKTENKLLDFNEYLSDALEQNHVPDVDVIVIDEYHDTTPLMHSLLQTWIDAADVAIVLGDPQQVLTEYEGADPAHFEEIDLPEVQLNKTWRVPPQIWDVATNQLANTHTPVQPDFAQKGGSVTEVTAGTRIQYDRIAGDWIAPDMDAETDPSRLVLGNNDVMVLARTHRQVEGISTLLMKRGVIHRSQSGAWRDDNRLLNLHNALARLAFVEVDNFGWNSRDVVWRDTVGDDHPYVDCETDPETKLRADEFKALLRHIPARWLDCDRQGADQVAEAVDSPVSVLRVDNIVKDECWSNLTDGAKTADKFVQREGDSKLDTGIIAQSLSRYDYEPTVAVDSDGDGLEDTPVVRTIHASKGSEAETVILYDGVTRKIRKSVRKNINQRRNEDRVWYVALTRASSDVVIVRDAFEWCDRWLPQVENDDVEGTNGVVA